MELEGRYIIGINSESDIAQEEFEKLESILQKCGKIEVRYVWGKPLYSISAVIKDFECVQKLQESGYMVHADIRTQSSESF